MKIRNLFIFLIIISITTIGFSQDIVETKTGMIYTGIFVEIDSTYITFIPTGVNNQQRLPRKIVERVILSDRKIFFENGEIIPDTKEIFINIEEHKKLFPELISHQIQTNTKVSEFDSISTSKIKNSYHFVDMTGVRLIARKNGFDIDSPLKGRFFITVNGNEISSIFPPQYVSQTSFKMIYYSEVDTFKILSLPIDSVSFIGFQPSKKSCINSFFRYSSLSFITGITAAAIAEGELSYILGYGLFGGFYAIPTFALAGLVTWITPKYTFYDSKDYFKYSGNWRWSIGLKFGSYSSAYWRYYSADYSDFSGQLPATGLNISFGRKFSPYSGSLSIYRIPIHKVTDIKGDYGMIFFPSLKICMFNNNRIQVNSSFGIFSQMEVLSNQSELYIDDAGIWGGCEIEILLNLTSIIALGVSGAPQVLLQDEAKFYCPFFINLKFTPYPEILTETLKK